MVKLGNVRTDKNKDFPEALRICRGQRLCVFGESDLC